MEVFGAATILADNILTYVQVAEAVATTIAIIAGGWWFFVRRENVRKANISHEVMFAEAGKQVYVGVRVTIRNTGRRRIESDSIEVKPGRPLKPEELGNIVVIEELSPFLGETEPSYQELSPEFNLQFLGLRRLPGKIVIEPDEEQVILVDFLIPGTTTAIKVYSHIDNAYTGSNGWNTSTIHHVVPNDPMDKPEKPEKKGAKL